MASVGSQRSVEANQGVKVSGATAKNQAAIGHLTDNPALASRLSEKRLVIISPDQTNASGILIAEALGELLGRLWANVDASGNLAKAFLDSARQAAESGGQALAAREAWQPPYDYVIGIGTDIPPGAGPGLRIGASGWTVSAGSHAIATDDMNPVGPLAAAAIAAAEAFKVIFQDGIASRLPLPEPFAWSAWYGGLAEPSGIPALELGNLCFVGVGSVTHALLWMLERWPAPAKGRAALVDPDYYDESNGQRYLGMRRDDTGKSKSRAVAARLKSKLGALDAEGFDSDMNGYFTKVEPDCDARLVVAGLDSVEARRQLQLKLPLRMVDMWTSGEYYGACTYGFDGTWPCAFCVHPEAKTMAMDEVAEIARETGLVPAKVRDLLYSASVLREADASIVAAHYGIPLDRVIGKPLRTLRGEMCATGKISLPKDSVESEVPLVFSAVMAGVGGFVELVREVLGVGRQPGWWQSTAFKYPTEMSWAPRDRVPGCYLCSDGMVGKVLAAKYVRPEL